MNAFSDVCIRYEEHKGLQDARNFHCMFLSGPTPIIVLFGSAVSTRACKPLRSRNLTCARQARNQRPSITVFVIFDTENILEMNAFGNGCSPQNIRASSTEPADSDMIPNFVEVERRTVE